MRKFLLVMVSLLFCSQVYAQPELRLVSSGGELNCMNRAKCDFGTTPAWNYFSGAGLQIQGFTLGPMTGSIFPSEAGVPANASIGPNESKAKSTSTGKLIFTGTQNIGSTFVTNPYISLSNEQSQYCFVKGLTVEEQFPIYIKYALGDTHTAGRYGFVVTPNNPGSWTTQEVACRFQLSGIGVATTPQTTVSNFREQEQYVKIVWGTSYIIATFNIEDAFWTVVKSYKDVNGNMVVSYTETTGSILDVDVMSYQTVTSSSFLAAEVQVSMTPTANPQSLPDANSQNKIKQSVINYLGTGGGDGSLTAYGSSGVTLTLQAKLKD